MAKEKLTVAQIRQLMQTLNPRKFGANADPFVPKRTKFILTGRIKDGAGGEKREQYVDITTISEEAKKANPGLTTTRFLRILKTDDVPEVVNPTDVLHTARNPIPDNLFERSNPMLYETLVRLLKDKDDKGNYKYFVKLEADGAGNPRLKLTNPVMGVFVTINVPGHYKLDKDGKILSGSKKDISTNKFSPKEKIVFRTDTFFVFEHEIDRIEEICIGRYQKLIEPMLSEEVIVTLDEGGNIIKKDIAAPLSAGAENEEHEEKEKTVLATGDDGELLP